MAGMAIFGAVIAVEYGLQTRHVAIFAPPR
jgi:hypothetical protein